jgi:hypothetical protein
MPMLHNHRVLYIIACQKWDHNYMYVNVFCTHSLAQVLKNAMIFMLTWSWVHRWQLGNDDLTEIRIDGSFPQLFGSWHSPGVLKPSWSHWKQSWNHLEPQILGWTSFRVLFSSWGLKEAAQSGLVSSLAVIGVAKPRMETTSDDAGVVPHLPEKGSEFRYVSTHFKAGPWPSLCPAPAVAFPKGSWRGSCGMRHCCGRSHLPLWGWGMTKKITNKYGDEINIQIVI